MADVLGGNDKWIIYKVLVVGVAASKHIRVNNNIFFECCVSLKILY